MTGKGNSEREALDRLAKALVDDILDAPDEEILADFEEAGGDAVLRATEMRALFERSVIAANKQRLAEAKAGVARSRKPGSPSSRPVDITQARTRLRAFFNSPNARPTLTIAARKESELSDSDIIGLLSDLQELGLLPPEDDDEGAKDR